VQSNGEGYSPFLSGHSKCLSASISLGTGSGVGSGVVDADTGSVVE